MNLIKRIMLVIIAAVLLVSTAVTVYAAPSPQKEEIINMTMDDGTIVTLWKMPDYLDKLSEKARSKYQRFLPLEPDETLYLGEVTSGKRKGSLVSILEVSETSKPSRTASGTGTAASGTDAMLRNPHGVMLLASYANMQAAESIRSLIGRKTSDIKSGLLIADSNADAVSKATVNTIRAELDAAYAEIKRVESRLNKLNPEVKDKATLAGVPIEDCKVTQLFDFTVYTNDDALIKDNDIGKVTMSIKVVGKTVDNLVCLLHRVEGKWEIVKETRAVRDTLYFTVTSCSPFAIVTWNNDGVGTAVKQSPKTGDNTLAWAAVATAGVLAAAAAAFVVLRVLRKKDE